jgi:flagellin FlaB
MHMHSTFMKRLRSEERGITGLETAIILIAFVVVASVFAYTVLSAGIFSAEKGKEAVHSGLQTARGSMEIVGPVVAKDTGSDNDVDQVIFTVANALEGEPIDLTTTTDGDADGLLSDEATKNHLLIASLSNASEELSDIAWTKTQVGWGDGDNYLEPGEKFELTVNVAGLTTDLDAYDSFRLELKPDKGAVIVIERTLPATIDDVMDLN